MFPFLALAQEELAFHAAVLRYRAGHRFRPPARRVLVNGSPKSGTTWAVRLLATLPPHRAVGNYRGDLSRYPTTPPGAVIHGHDPYTPELAALLRESDIRVILMLRDPRDQVVSRLFHIRRDASHPWHARMNALDDDAALLACICGGADLPGLDVLLKLPLGWLEEPAARVVRYEALLTATEHELGRMLAHLGLHAAPALLRAVVHRNRFARLRVGKHLWRLREGPMQENPASHFRKGIAGDWKSHLTAQHLACLQEVAGAELAALGYAASPTESGAAAARWAPTPA